MCVCVVTIVIVIVVLVLIVVGMSGKRKAVGGVKGKKVLKTERMDKKKVKMKSVKVGYTCL